MARYFPEEVIVEILSWLPLKSLMRFKCVSKPWLQLLTTDLRLMKLHFNRSIHKSNPPSPPGILVSRRKDIPRTEFYYAEEYTSFNELTRFEIPFSHLHCPISTSVAFCYDFHLVNICNGLICLTNYDQDDHSNVYIWNPLTKDHIIIPCSPIPSHFRATNIMFGFGFNQASDEYKVMRIVSTSPFVTGIDELQSHVSVYTLGTGSSWRVLEEFAPYNISKDNWYTALVNGSLHWFGNKLNGSVGLHSHQTLIAFNMHDEVFKEIPQPDDIAPYYGYPSGVIVGELGGLLCIFCRLQCVSLEIWVMEEYGVADSWRKLCKIGENEVSGMFLYLTPLGVADSGEIIISNSPWKWISYDPNTNSVRYLHKFEFQAFDAHTFKGSLLSPTIINGANRTRHTLLD